MYRETLETAGSVQNMHTATGRQDAVIMDRVIYRAKSEAPGFSSTEINVYIHIGYALVELHEVYTTLQELFILL